MVKVFISQLMRNKTDTEILHERNILKEYAERNIEGEIEFIDSFIRDLKIPENIKNESVYYLSRSIAYLAEADVILMGKGTEHGRGTLIEFKIAESYDIPIMCFPEYDKT